MFYPGPYAGYLAMVLPVCLHLYLCISKDKTVIHYLEKGMIALTGIPILCVLPATMSRSAWIAAAVGCGWVAYMHRDKRRWYVLWERYKRRYVLWGTGIFFVLILGGVGAFVLKPDSALGRLFMWKVTCKAIANHPWGCEKGFAFAYGEAQESYFEQGNYAVWEERVAGSPEYAFNEYLSLALTEGIAVCAVVVVVIGMCLRMGMKRGRYPKLIYVLEDDNICEGTPYFYLTKLAAKCTAKRMVPDYISEKKMKEYKLSKGETEGNGDVFTCMGCRSFLTPDRSGTGWNNVANAKNYVPGKPKYYGRFNQGVVTINLPDVALSSGGEPDKFWKIFDERLELCHRALQYRHNRLKGTLSDAAPILWQYGALARLKKGEPIDKLLYGGYSTISLGYAGLYECCKYMTGKSHTDPAAKPFALSVMQHMNDKCNEWKNAENIDYSLYGTPLESTTYKFAKCLQKRFGIVPGITDRNYITNSYHVHVTEQIDAFTKLKFESEFQRLSPGGAISYVEVPNMQDNLEAVIKVMQFIYDNIMYAELNTKSDYCQVCGYDGEIKIVEDDGKLVWECPHCHNRDQSKLNVARRTCGYIGTQFWNQGRTAEIKDRVLHL